MCFKARQPPRYNRGHLTSDVPKIACREPEVRMGPNARTSQTHLGC